MTDPLFEVVTAATEHKLTSAANVRSVIGSPSGDDTLIGTMIDRASALAARYCRLADDGSHRPTFASEALRATWYKTSLDRGSSLLLPWRLSPSLTTVVEDGETLTSSDYSLRPGGLLVRMDDDLPICWSMNKIVVTFSAGWTLPTSTPPDIEAAIIDQVKMVYQTRERDITIRSETTQDVGSASYSVVGGDSIGASGLFLSVESALAPYRLLGVS